MRAAYFLTIWLRKLGFGGYFGTRYQVGTGVRLALLKAKSPSCGFGQVYDGTFTGTLVAGRGLTAELLSDADVRVLTENDLDLLASLKTQEDPAC